VAIATVRVSQSVSVLYKVKRLELSTPNLVHGSHRACIDFETERSRSHGYQMCCQFGYGMSIVLLRFSSFFLYFSPWPN